MTGRDPVVLFAWAHCAALKAAVAHPFQLFGAGDPGANRTASFGMSVQAPDRIHSNLENSIASASIVSASEKGHPVDALALEADEGRCRLR